MTSALLSNTFLGIVGLDCFSYRLRKDVIVATEKDIKMNTDETPKTCEALTRYFKSTVKSIDYRRVIIEWE